MKKLLIAATSIGFGYGPSSGLQSLLVQIPDKIRKYIQIIIPKTTHQVWKQQKYNQLYFSNSEELNLLLESKEYQILLNFGNTNLLAQDIHIRHMFIDCVTWLSTSNNKIYNSINNNKIKYFAEYFPPTNQNKLPNNITLVRPSLFPYLGNVANEALVLISIGGNCTPDNDGEYNIIYELALLIRKRIMIIAPNHKVLIAGGFLSISSKLRERSIRTLSLESHLRVMSRASLVITVPGLYSVFEAIRLRKPIIMMPPTNYTQAVQFNWYAKNGLIDDTLNWLKKLDITWDGTEAQDDGFDEKKLIDYLRRKLSQDRRFFNEVFEKIINEIADNYLNNEPIMDRNNYLYNKILKKYNNPILPTLLEALGEDFIAIK
jgi:hypothetical protein